MKHKEDTSIEHAQRLAKMEKRAFEILRLKPGASRIDIKRAYWILAMENHPDKNPKDRDAGERFKVITAAYEFLTGKSGYESFLRYRRETTGNDPARSGKYDTTNAWGHFLWWREKFF